MTGKWKAKNVFFILEIQPLSGFHYFSRHGTLAWKSRKNDVRFIEHRFCINSILFTIHAKIIHPLWGCMADKDILLENINRSKYLETQSNKFVHWYEGRISEPCKP